MYFLFEILGTAAFAISGTMVAIEKKMDILGVIFLGMTTAVGGGIIRDTLIGQTPPGGLTNPVYAIVAIAVSLVVFIPTIRKHVDVNHWGIVLIDAIGLGTFTVTGCRTGAAFENIWLQLFLGVLTGVGGGVLRDIFATEKPMVFVRHFYATASICGAVVYSLLLSVNETVAMIAGICLVVVLRMLAAHFKWHLPKA